MSVVSNTYSGVVVENESRTVNAGETYLDTMVNSGGSFLIVSGGTADVTTVNDSGALHVSNGGIANDTTVNPGDVVVTGWGQSHSIRNECDQDLEFIAVINTEN